MSVANGVNVNHGTRSDRLWMVASIALAVAVALALRFGTDVLEFGGRDDDSRFRFDERWITAPIFELIERGWSVETAIDFQETKGPGMIWPYAAAGALTGKNLNRLRAVSVILFVLGVVPLVWIARWCGARGPALAGAAAFYILLPYNAVLGQLIMSEALFDFTALLLMIVFLWGFGHGGGATRRVAGPVLFGLILSIMLHNRLHAVAFAGAACLTAFERDRMESWPWWAASIGAGLSRLPLWARWGGPVGSRFQSQHDVGIGLESLTYLGAAMAPLLAVFLIIILLNRRHRSRVWMVLAGGMIGVALGLIAAPQLGQKLPFEGSDIARFHGPAASLVRAFSSSEIVQAWLVRLLAVIGLAGLGALGAVTWEARIKSSPREKRVGAPAPIDANTLENNYFSVVARLAFWTLVCGWGMYAFTVASVFDRYLLPWAILLPIVYVNALPRWLAIAQGFLLAAIAGQHVWQWLVVH